MSAERGELDVVVESSSIVITDPKTEFTVIYQSRFGTQQLVLAYSWVSENETSPAIAEFRRRAYDAAIAKARELRWIA